MCKLRVLFIVCLVAWAFVDSFTTKKGKVGIEIGYLDSIPAEIDGGLCTFYKSLDDVEKDRYVLTNDSAENAYMMVKDKLEKFSLVANNDETYLYVNKDYELTVKISGTRFSAKRDYTYIVAFLIIENRNHDRRKIKCYGFCGC